MISQSSPSSGAASEAFASASSRPSLQLRLLPVRERPTHRFVVCLREKDEKPFDPRRVGHTLNRGVFGKRPSGDSRFRLDSRRETPNALAQRHAERLGPGIIEKHQRPRRAEEGGETLVFHPFEINPGEHFIAAGPQLDVPRGAKRQNPAFRLGHCVLKRPHLGNRHRLASRGGNAPREDGQFQRSLRRQRARQLNDQSSGPAAARRRFHGPVLNRVREIRPYRFDDPAIGNVRLDGKQPSLRRMKECLYATLDLPGTELQRNGFLRADARRGKLRLQFERPIGGMREEFEEFATIGSRKRRPPGLDRSSRNDPGRRQRRVDPNSHRFPVVRSTADACARKESFASRRRGGDSLQTQCGLSFENIVGDADADDASSPFPRRVIPSTALPIQVDFGQA